ncbi:unnamed protein product [Sphagnum balticum]
MPRGTDTTALKVKLGAFLRSFCATVALVIAEYFENPYYAESSCVLDGPKRPFNHCEDSEDELMDFGVPKKHRKSSI